ncbi:MAG: GIY-YIG nuclease family protein [Bacteroidetes bacterium]|nr:MAG: GIY-YIG nuclease family protein [Bacteroidota bacterium]
MKAGFVYILLNPSFPDTLKIGQSKNPDKRALSLFKAGKAGIPTKFLVVYRKKVSDCELVEKLVHEKLDDYRINDDREFFIISIEDAISEILSVINELAKQNRLQFIADEPQTISNEAWWTNLNFVWKSTFRGQLKIVYEPLKLDLLGAINLVINYSQNKDLRQKVASLVVNYKFAHKLIRWYEGLGKEQKAFNYFLPYELSEQQIKSILELKEIKCNNDLALLDLTPLQKLSKLEFINNLDTNILDFTPLQTLINLKKISFDYLTMENLTPLEKEINMDRIKALRKLLPNCEII